MYYVLEIWKNGECGTTKSLTRKHAQEHAEEIEAEYRAITEAAGLVYNLHITIHQCIQAIEFKTKEK